MIPGGTLNYALNTAAGLAIYNFNNGLFFGYYVIHHQARHPGAGIPVVNLHSG